MLLTRFNLIGTLHHARLLETKWRAQKLLYREVDKLHDFSIRPQIMRFFCFFLKEVLISRHLTSERDLSPSLSMLYGYAYLSILSGHIPLMLINGWTLPGSGGIVRRVHCILFNYNSSQHRAECTTRFRFDVFAVFDTSLSVGRCCSA